MKKRSAAFLLLAVLVIQSLFGTALADPDDGDIVIKEGEQSDNVILLQMRLQDLGYYNYKITGFFGEFTKKALIDFQKTNGLKDDGVAGSKTLDLMYGNNAKRNPVEDVNPPPKPKPPKKTRFGAYIDWSTVSRMWPRGAVCTVIDFNTGKSYKMKRVGGIYHADVAPIDKANNAIFEKTYGGQYPNWDRRAVVVIIGGQRVAGSTNGYPHGSTGVPNNGMSRGSHLLQVCIHFKNSKTHIHNMMDPAHQYEVRRAAGLPVGSKPALADN